MDKKLIIGIVAAVALVGGLVIYFAASPSQVAPVVAPAPPPLTPLAAPQPPLPQPPPPALKATSTKPVVKPTQSTQAAITGVVFSKAITATGAPTSPATTFSSSTPTIYAVLSLKNAIQRTELSYVRYYEGKYVNSGLSHPSKDGMRYFHFKFVLTPGQTRKVGHYTLNFYVNGKKSQSVSYFVQ